MATRPILIHMKKVKEALREVSPQHAFVFAATCTERQWPVYKRASEGKRWERQTVLRSTLDAVWGWLSGQQTERPRHAEECERAICDEDPVQDEDNAAFYVANNFYGLAAIIENDEAHYSNQSANANLDLIDAFLYDLLDLQVSSESDLAVDTHELMQEEVRRQLHDLDLLRRPFTPSLVEELRMGSVGQSILGDYWYS